MRRVTLAALAAIMLILGPLVLWGCGQNKVAESVTAPASTTQNTLRAEGAQTRTCVRFTAPVSYDQLAAEAEQYHVTPSSIRIDFGDFSSEYSFAGHSMRESKSDFLMKHEEFLTFKLERAREEANAEPGSSRTYARFSQLLSEAHAGRISVTAACFSTLPIPAEQIGGRAVTPDSIDAPRLMSKTEEIPGITSTGHESWAPYKGWSKVTTGMSYQEFYFNNTSGFAGGRTYEHETQVYDKNFADYANYTSSNLPSWYFDTPFLDSIDNFTVGTYHADYLYAYSKYWAYIALKAGSASSATCRIKGQIGHMLLGCWYTPWCVYADATTGTMAYLTVPNYGTNWAY